MSQILRSKSKDWLYAPLITLVVVVLLLEWLVKIGFIPKYLFAAPSDVLKILFSSEDSEIWPAFRESLLASLVGFLLSIVGGILLGVLFSSADWFRKALYPYTTFFQTVPIIAIAPVVVIWFGYGFGSVVAITVIIAIFPVLASTLSGLQSADPALLDLFKLYRAKRFQTLLKLRIPFSLPYLLTGLRISSGLSVIGVIVGEFIAGGGLGGLIDVSRARQQMDQLFASVFLAALIGLALLSAINLLGHFLLKNWHPSERK